MCATFWLAWKEQCSNWRRNLVPEESGPRFTWHTYQKSAPQKWSEFMAPVSGACVMGWRMFIQSVRSKPRMYVYALLDSVLAMDVNKYPVTTVSCQQRWQTNWIHLNLYLAAEQRTLGRLVTTNHNQAAVRGLVSQPITAIVGHLTWQLVATLLTASADPEALSALEVFLWQCAI